MTEAAELKRSISLNLDAELVRKAEALGLDLAAAAENAIMRLIDKNGSAPTEESVAELVQFWNDYEARYLSVAEEFGTV